MRAGSVASEHSIASSALYTCHKYIFPCVTLHYPSFNCVSCAGSVHSVYSTVKNETPVPKSPPYLDNHYESAAARQASKQYTLHFFAKSDEAFLAIIISADFLLLCFHQLQLVYVELLKQCIMYQSTSLKHSASCTCHVSSQKQGMNLTYLRLPS